MGMMSNERMVSVLQAICRVLLLVFDAVYACYNIPLLESLGSSIDLQCILPFVGHSLEIPGLFEWSQLSQSWLPGDASLFARSLEGMPTSTVLPRRATSPYGTSQHQTHRQAHCQVYRPRRLASPP